VERTNSWHNAHKKLVYGEAWASERFLGGFFRYCDNRQATHPRRLESLPLGGSTFPDDHDQLTEALTLTLTKQALNETP
jgi:hypothetical protein